MPVIRYVPPDPTDLVLQGAQLTLPPAFPGWHAPAAPFGPLLPGSDAEPDLGMAEPDLVAGEQLLLTMVAGDGMGYPVATVGARLTGQADGSLLRANALIATPCGALINTPLGLHLMNAFVQSAQRWALTGVTRDSTGAALGNCAVVVMETGRINVGGAAVDAMTTSDGSGNYSVELPNNGAHSAFAYLVGSPNRAGVTLNTITPVANG